GPLGDYLPSRRRGDAGAGNTKSTKDTKGHKEFIKRIEYSDLGEASWSSCPSCLSSLRRWPAVGVVAELCRPGGLGPRTRGIAVDVGLYGHVSERAADLLPLADVDVLDR